MAHLTALLIVLAMTGQPVANALCIRWCDFSPERQECGGAIAQTAVPRVTVAQTTCAAALVAAPFVREDGLSATHVGKSLAAADVLRWLIAPQPHCDVVNVMGTTPSRQVSVVVLRV